MEISASDIRNRSFSKSLRGLTEEEVYTFLNEIADRWSKREERTQKLEGRVQTLKGKLDEIGDTADKVQEARQRAQTLQKEAEKKQKRLAEKEQELTEKQERLERTQAKLRSVANHLQDTLQEQQRTLSSLGLQNGSATPQDQPPASPSSSDQSNGKSDSSSNEKSTEEWVDSLFPNRLPEKDAGGAPTEEPENPSDETGEGDMSASESQFEAIKEDVQGMDSEGSQNASKANQGEEEESPPTDEMNRIWDVFDEPGRG